MNRFFLRRFFLTFACFLCVIGLVAAIIVLALINTMNRDMRARMLISAQTSANNLSLLIDNGNFQQALLTFESSVSSTICDVLENDAITYKDIPIRDLLKYTVYSPTILNEHIESVYLYVPNSKNNFLSSNLLVQNLFQAVDASWYKEYQRMPKEKDVWVSSRIEGHFAFETPRQMISVYQRLTFSDGVLVLNILPDSLSDAISQQVLHPDETALLFNTEGTLLLSTQPEITAGLEYGNLLDGVTEEEISDCSIDGQDWFITKKSIPQYGLAYFLLSSKESVYRSVAHILMFCGVAVLVAVFASGLMSWSVTARNTERLQTVIDLFARAERGQPIPPLREKDIDEYDVIINHVIKTFLNHSYLKLQLKGRYQEAKIAQLTALQLQINPHFLFNTLQIIDFEILKINQKYCDANVLIKRLSNILMYCLRNTDCAVTLGSEIERTKDYFFIQQSRRQQGALLVDWDCSASVVDTPCLCMILQPFVENSITHGARGSGEPLSLRISIHPTRDARSIRVRIIDNGCGITPDVLERLRTVLTTASSADIGAHIGIYNTVIRLQLFCGERLHFRMQSIVNFGTMIQFDIPNDV